MAGSGRLLNGRFLFPSFPVERRQLFDLSVGRRGQSLQHILEIGAGFDSVHPAVLDEGVHHRAALPGFLGSEEQPVLPFMERSP